MHLSFTKGNVGDITVQRNGGDLTQPTRALRPTHGNVSFKLLPQKY